MDFVQVDREKRFEDPHAGETLIHSRFRRSRISISAKAPSLKYVLSGTETYTCGGVRLALRPGDLLFVRPGVEMSVDIDGDHDTIGLCSYLDDRDVAGLDAPLLMMRAPDVCAAAAAMLGARVNRSALNAKALRDGFDDLKGAGLEAAKRGYDTYRRLGQVRETVRLDLFMKLDRARAFILDHVDRPISLDVLARHACISKYHFLRQFKAAYGVSPMRYYTDARLDVAWHRLHEAPACLDDVAAACGYSGQSAFSKAFKKRYGFSPSLLRSSGD